MVDKDEQLDSVQAVEAAQKVDDNLIRLSSGVVLRAKKANPLVMIRVMAAFPRPKPPVWMDPKMGREMENPDDPDYRDRLRSWEMEFSSATLNAMIMLGTELESLPKGFPGPHPETKKAKSNGSDELEWPAWISEYELLGVPTHRTNPGWRYLTWVMFKAVVDERDLEKIRDTVGRLSGISESAVKSAENFPGGK